jgi:single-stranded-DNA-specific exonuclease
MSGLQPVDPNPTLDDRGVTPDGGALAPRYHWVLPEPHPLSAATIEAARRLGLSARALRVLSRRGPLDEAELAARFDPPEGGLHDPLLLPDAQLVLRRVAEARARSERVMVVGDFDADGLTGLAILVEAFRWLGLEAEGHIPDRAAEGHGLSLAAVERARERGCSLVFTVDTGSTSHAEVEAARECGIDVIITDHHVVPAVPPAALALVNPHRHDSRYPDARLSGAGVAFKVAQLLMGQHPGGAGEALGLADLAAIGLVADVMPIAGENRCIVRLGLRRLSEARRPGLAALMASARLDPARISLEDLGFALAPRINAMGRVGDPAVAADLLAAPDRAAADMLAARLEEANDLRRQLTADALVEARAAAEATAADPFVVVSGDWPLGVIGLMAGRLGEELSRPALVISEQVDPWRGSARSAGGFDLVAAFDACADLFERYGGHPAAAGCHVPPERVEELRRRLVALAAGRPPVDRRASLVVDLVQSAESADYVLLRELAPLEGAGERPPLIGVAGLAVIRARGANGGHTQVTLRRGREVVDAICFGRPDLAERLGEGQEVDVVARLVSRTFAGLETLQLEVRDVAPTGRLAGLRAAARDRREHPVAIHRPASGGPAR